MNVEFSITSRVNVSLRERIQQNQETKRLQGLIRDEAFAATENNPLFVPAGLFASSINSLIDIKTERYIAFANHVPEIFLLG